MTGAADRPLAGLVAIVAGAQGTIGERVAVALADAGAAVGLLCSRPDQVDITVKEIHGAGGTAVAIGCDITDDQQTQHAVDRTVAELGRLDIVVNNAGVAVFDEIDDAAIDDWHRMLAVNLAGTMHLAHAAVPHLIAAAADGRGVADLVGVTSAVSREVRVGAAVHRATQDGMAAYLANLRTELASRHVRVALLECDAVDPLPHDVPHPRTPSAGTPPLRPDDVATTLCHLVSRPPEVAIAQLRIVRSSGWSGEEIRT